MREHTVQLLKAFYKICRNDSNRTGLKRISLGLAIVSEAGIDIRLSHEGGSYTKDSPLFSEICACFKEMIENDWIEEIQPSEYDKIDFFMDYKEYITKVGLTHYSNPENMGNELGVALWPFGDCWFLLKAKGEEFAKRKLQDEKINQKVANIMGLPPVFPNIIPDKIIEERIHKLENNEFNSKEEIDSLIKEMHKYPDRQFYLYVQHGKAINKYLQKAKINNEILMDECEFYFYRHPKNNRDFVKIHRDNIKFDWEDKVVKESPMYKRIKLVLSEEKRRMLAAEEIGDGMIKDGSLSSPLELKPNFYGIGIDLKKVVPWLKSKFGRKRHKSSN